MDPTGNTEMTSIEVTVYRTWRMNQQMWPRQLEQRNLDFFSMRTGCLTGILYTLNNQFFFIAHLVRYMLDFSGDEKILENKNQRNMETSSFFPPTPPKINLEPENDFQNVPSLRRLVPGSILVCRCINISSYSFLAHLPRFGERGGRVLLSLLQESRLRFHSEKVIICHHIFWSQWKWSIESPRKISNGMIYLLGN